MDPKNIYKIYNASVVDLPKIEHFFSELPHPEEFERYEPRYGGLVQFERGMGIEFIVAGFDPLQLEGKTLAQWRDLPISFQGVTQKPKDFRFYDSK